MLPLDMISKESLTDFPYYRWVSLTNGQELIPVISEAAVASGNIRCMFSIGGIVMHTRGVTMLQCVGGGAGGGLSLSVSALPWVRMTGGCSCCY